MADVGLARRSAGWARDRTTRPHRACSIGRCTTARPGAEQRAERAAQSELEGGMERRLAAGVIRGPLCGCVRAQTVAVLDPSHRTIALPHAGQPLRSPLPAHPAGPGRAPAGVGGAPCPTPLSPLRSRSKGAAAGRENRCSTYTPGVRRVGASRASPGLRRPSGPSPGQFCGLLWQNIPGWRGRRLPGQNRSAHDPGTQSPRGYGVGMLSTRPDRPGISLAPSQRASAARVASVPGCSAPSTRSRSARTCSSSAMASVVRPASA